MTVTQNGDKLIFTQRDRKTGALALTTTRSASGDKLTEVLHLYYNSFLLFEASKNVQLLETKKNDKIKSFSYFKLKICLLKKKEIVCNKVKSTRTYKKV